jgi:hypothetical protein
MIEPSQQRMIEQEEVKQRATREEHSVADQRDTTDELVRNGSKEHGYAAEQAQQVNEPIREAAPTGLAEQSVNQHAEAGRKGARRIHELIQQGRLYEREHGLKPGRQRLRQLIQEGKLYEQEHGLRGGSKTARERRRPRISSEQLLKTLFQSLLRLAKPAYRSRILDLIHDLDGESK